MNSDVVIVDYGVGNLFSVFRAFEHCGANVEISNNPAVILAAPRLVLPGVGAFADGMNGLIARGLDNIIIAYANTGKPLLGICLGMQMLATSSEEFGMHQGLDIISGRVRSISRSSPEGKLYKVPYVGWADLHYKDHETSWKGSILDGLVPGDAVYLTHTFAVTPSDSSQRLAYCIYNGEEVTSAIRKDNVYGVQFHPEKSGPVGLQIIKNFATLRKLA